ncbi:MAG: hypothetical protein GXP08_16740 [Gammaproteobacteria bacterium]|nr:hypothetical protein [Gammaproteobacteria bacterium]
MQWNNPNTAIVLALAALMISSASPGYAQSLSKLWQKSKAPVYQAPAMDELRKAEHLFRQHFNGYFGTALIQQWKKLGFGTHVIEQNNNRFFIIREHARHRDGRGFFIFSLDRKPGIILQAPHSYYDRFTGHIVMKLILANTTISAAAWNTTARYSNTGNRTSADLAHLSESYFTAFSRAFSSINAGTLIQVHGFAKDKRRTSQAANADIIISSTTQIPGKRAQMITQCLKSNTPFLVRIYPWEVQELGGTTNTVAAALRAAGSSAFVHLELNLASRKQLLDNKTLQQLFSQCLAAGAPL